MWGRRALLLAAAASSVLLPLQTWASEASDDSYQTAVGEEVVRDVLRGQGLLSTLQKLTARRENANVTVAPILFIGRDDGLSSQLLTELFDFVEGTSTQSQVAVAPYGDAGGEEGERQSVAVVTNVESEDLLTSAAFPTVAKDVAVSFAVSSDVVVPVHFTDVLRGEATSALLQVALEHLLHFQHRGLISRRPKRLHVLVLGADAEEASSMGLRAALDRQLSALWDRVIKPSGDEEGEEEAPLQWSDVLEVNVAMLPSPTHDAEGFASGVAELKNNLEAQLSSGVPFVRGKTLEGAVGALLPLSKDLMKPKASLPRQDTVVSAFLLDKLLTRYQTQFRMDARVLLEAERGYNAEFAKTFNELIEKYLTSFTQEVYGGEGNGGVNTYLQGLDAGQVSAVVRAKRDRLRGLLLSSVEPAYRRQLEFLRKLAMDELRKGLAGLKYNWELVPGLAKATKAGRALFREGAAKTVCRGAKWSSSSELAALTKAMDQQVNDILEAQRARGVYVPEKLRRPIGVQVNWLGANFFHFVQDATCDPLSIRTDAGVLRQASQSELDAIQPERLDYLRTKVRGDADAKLPLMWGWSKRIAFEPFARGSRPRNHDDMTYQFNMPKHIAQY